MRLTQFRTLSKIKRLAQILVTKLLILYSANYILEKYIKYLFHKNIFADRIIHLKKVYNYITLKSFYLSILLFTCIFSGSFRKQSWYWDNKYLFLFFKNTSIDFKGVSTLQCKVTVLIVALMAPSLWLCVDYTVVVIFPFKQNVSEMVWNHHVYCLVSSHFPHTSVR